MSTGIILYLVEGKKERTVNEQIRYLNQINNFEVLPSGPTIVYGTTIYGLFKEVEEYLADNIDFDLFPILTTLEARKENTNIEHINKNDISEIYLIFDYDPHASNFSKEKIRKMCEIFNDEYTIGKLFINYPMIEVFRHCYKLTKSNISFTEAVYPLSKQHLLTYKNHVSSIYPEIQNMDCSNTLKKVIKDSILKSNLLINSEHKYPDNKSSIQQQYLLEKQLSYEESFHLLSGIPLLIHHYHRDEILINFLEISIEPTL